MYKLQYLKTALDDIYNILNYITDTLKNKSSAENLLKDMINSAERLIDFPYSAPVYIPIKKLKYEYRKLLVKNYIMFYYVDELTKTIVISRVIYARQNYKNKL